MAKFKVGDEVKLGGGRAKVIHIESTGDFPYLVERADNRIEFCNDAELYPLLPAIPPGWTPASEPPDNSRKVRVLTPDGLCDGLHLVVFGEYAWRLFSGNTIAAHFAAPGEVLAWCEIEPAAKPAAQVRYAVTYKGEGDSYDFDDENCYSTLESATQAAKRQSVDANKPAEIWKLVAIVNPPAEPEVIRMEE